MIAVLIAGAVGMLLSLAGTRALISFFQRLGKGQPILGAEDHGPVHQMAKQGTPTMGGIAILLSGFIGWLVAHLRDGLPFSDQAAIIWLTVFVLATVGFLDDYLKVKRQFIVWTAVMVWSTTNAVNVTDGLDGLAAGSALFGFLAFTIIAYWAFRNPRIYDIVNPLDLAVLSAALAGACGGFLWWNAAPAQIFMGDVGALGLGAALGTLAVTTNTHLMLLIICGINVLEAGSVAVQMGVFKASGRKKRLFKMSPIHHHFELSGWPETTVIIRFWIISGICVATAVAIFIADFTNQVSR
jgi:phospho-N-acetylmuramoyl-pentapeptide-transferase